jgi:DNA-binding beta-propeller fold protein YncE
MKLRTIPALLLLSATLPAAPPDRIQRLLYVTDRTGISVYDIDGGHKLVRKIELPGTGDYKGISASPQLGRLFVTSYKQDELLSVDLQDDHIVWRKKLGSYADSMWTTPDGKRLYVPYRDEIFWKVVDASTGGELARIDAERGKNYDVDPIATTGPHNTWINRQGTRAYLEVLTVPNLYIVETRSNQIIGKIGPFSKGIRPFAISDDEKYAYCNVDGLLGFEVGAVRKGDRWGGPMLYRVEAHTPPERLTQVHAPPHKPHSTPSHGINLRPDQKEVWMVDGVYGEVYVFDVTSLPPKQIATVPIFKDPSEQPHPGWLTFSIDGKYAYPDGGAVIDTATKRVVARIPTSEKLIEIDFENGKAVKAGHR